MGILQTLYKPVGQRELALIEMSGWTRFPPRVARRPVFYTDMSEDELLQVKTVTEVNCIIKCHVRKEYLEKYEMRHISPNDHDELWLPIEALEDLNNNIIGLIELARVVR